MKAILMSIRPQHTCNILNDIKLWEIRKKFPKDYVGWVYIYVTKASPHLSKTRVGGFEIYDETQWDKEWLDLNGKVVARFWCDKVEEIDAYNLDKFAKDSCLTINEIEMYLWSNCCCGYAIHITKLEIFDKPKELSEFYGVFTQKRYERIFGNNAVELDKKYGGLRQPTKSGYEYTYPLTRAPQSWCYVEI